jgi:hypothetical protein
MRPANRITALTIIIALVAGSYYLDTSDVLTNHEPTMRGSTVITTGEPTSVYFRYGLSYLSSAPGGSISVSQSGPGYPAPVFGSESDAVVFDCASAAATPQGCMKTVTFKGTSNQTYTVKVWLPYLNASAGIPWENCRYAVTSVPIRGSQAPVYAYCISLNSTSFLVALPRPPPP